MSRNLTQEITKRWDQGFSPVEVAGLNPSSQAYVITQLLLSTSKQFAVLTPSSDDARRFLQDVKCLLTLFGHKDLIKSVDLLPGWEVSPYKGLNPSIKNRLRRVRTLSLLQGDSLRLVVCDVRSFCQRSPQPAAISNKLFSLKPGDRIQRQELESRLQRLGYSRNDPVEDPGSYSFRGYLLDVFSTGSKQPYRLEFFDDEIETIKSYVASTQKSDPTPLTEALIIPVQEWEMNDDSIQRAKSAIKNFCDHQGISKKTRDHFFSQLDHGVKEPTLEYLWPFFESQPTGWPADFMREWDIVSTDTLGLDQAFDELHTDCSEGFKTAIENGRLLPLPADLYASPEMFQRAKNGITLALNAVELGIKPLLEDDKTLSPKIYVNIETNADLKAQDSDNLKATLAPLIQKNESWTNTGTVRSIVSSSESQRERMAFLLNQRKVACRINETIDVNDIERLQITAGTLSSGFRIALDQIALVTDAEIFGPKKIRSSQTKASIPEDQLGSFISSLEDLVVGNLVVHVIHGIGRYCGLMSLHIDGIPQDYLLLEYQGGDKLYLPIYRLDQVQKYIGSTDNAALDKLGSAHFDKAKEKVKQALQEMAHGLLQLYARRATREGFVYSPADETLREFEAKFPYAETPDQQKAIDAVINDMHQPKIMDRLICGDVGYGKTEVAMRAAFRAVTDGKQTAVLVPTTVLAFQHERSFKERFKDYPITIAGLSRFKSTKEIKETLAGLKSGAIDIVIGTHRLLSRDVAFKDLGLVITDEEHRFGVEHKERLKMIRVNTDALTLTATPIPRTLQMSLMGIRDISIISTPPVDRLGVRTYVARFDEDIINKAIVQELSRGGQVYFVHNRVQSIHAMEERLKKLVPHARIAVGHGQMDEKELENKMLDFYDKKYDILLCSTIIESGLDIPTANTMIINRADTFGLAQLYQLRGRVGRSQTRAYCYLLLPEEGAITDLAKKRLEVIQRFADLGSGFKIASHDLELRGGGDMLGKNQSGHIAAVGFELYTDLLDETIREMRGEKVEERFDPEIKLPVAALIPEKYVPDVHQRLNFYKKLSQSIDGDAVKSIELEMEDRFGSLPPECINLLWLIRLKLLLTHHHIKALVAGLEKTSLEASGSGRISATKVLTLVRTEPQRYSLTPDSKIILRKPFTSAQLLYEEVRLLLSQVADDIS